MQSVLKALIYIFIFLLFSNQALAASLKKIFIKTNQSKAAVSFYLTQKTLGKVKWDPQKKILSIVFQQTDKHFNFKLQHYQNSLLKNIRCEMNANNLNFLLFFEKEIHWNIKFLPDKNKALVKLTIESDNSHLTLIKHQFIVKLKDLAAKANHYIVAGDKLIEERLNIKEKNQFKSPSISHPITIVIDPGHGGKDGGAVGNHGLIEKKIVLQIAKILAKHINQIPNMHAVLTREGDYFVPLRKRMELARKGKADLFIAIHADAYFNNHASGASVYAVSSHGATSEAARWLANQENYSELGKVALNALQDKSKELRSVLLDMAQTASIQDSLTLGNDMLRSLKKVTALHHHHVEQAPFMVLKAPDIPSILIETGFITNPLEERRLANPFYQKDIAQAITEGILQFVSKNC